LSRVELLRALADLAARPHAASVAIADALELSRPPTAAEHTDLFDFQVYPYASVHLGDEGMLGGDARDRIAGFLRALDVIPPPEPDHLVVLLHAYADLSDLAVSGAPRAEHACRVLLHEHLGTWVGRFLCRVIELGAEPLRDWARLTVDALAAELVRHGPPPELPSVLRDAAPLPEPEEATAAEWTQGLLTPVRSGLVIARADLARAAHDLQLGSRVGERAFTLRALLDQDARAVLGWIADEAVRQAEDLAQVAATGGDAVAAWWRARLEATIGMIARQLDGPSGPRPVPTEPSDG
jgi:TorA maturation chaperone TorD